jgi:cyclic pyranopterin phosphate synthase
LDISFIEEMPLGDIGHKRKDTFISNDEVLKKLQKVTDLFPLLLLTSRSWNNAKWAAYRSLDLV